MVLQMWAVIDAVPVQWTSDRRPVCVQRCPTREEGEIAQSTFGIPATHWRHVFEADARGAVLGQVFESVIAEGHARLDLQHH